MLSKVTIRSGASTASQLQKNAAAVQRVMVAILVLNVAVAGAKAGYGWISGSL